MASNAPVKMDVDNPLVLKRSSSAPMINELNTSTSAQTPPSSLSREVGVGVVGLQLMTGVPRMRRFSASFSPLGGGGTGGCYSPGGCPSPAACPGSPKLTPRVNQLRREESQGDLLGRETAHERELNSAMLMSQSCEDLTLLPDGTKDSSSSNDGDKPSPLALPPLCSTPSPTRPASVPLRHSAVFKTSLSPSPTRKFTTRRSQSPIAMRPSVLGPVKRKCTLEENEPPAKKFSGLLIQQARFDVGMKSPESGVVMNSFTPESTQVVPAEAKAD